MASLSIDMRLTRSVTYSCNNLLTIQQQKDETLKDYIIRFNREYMSIEDPNNLMMFAALYGGILPEGALMNKLIRKKPSTLDDLMNKV